MSYRLPEIVEIEERLVRERAEAVEQVRAIQATCAHPYVVHGGNRRICAACGLEETTPYSFGWPGYTIDGGMYEFERPEGKPTILNSEFVKQGDVVQHRVRV